MADKPVVPTFAENGRLDPSTLNNALDILAEGVENCLGRGGTSESPNSMEGTQDMDTNRIQNLGDPDAAGDAANVKYVDAAVANGGAIGPTAEELLTLIKTVDGQNSGLDTEFVEGKPLESNNISQSVVKRDSSGSFAAELIVAEQGLKGKVVSDDLTEVLDNGTDGTDATFTGDVIGDVTGDLTGDVTGSATKVGVLNVQVIDIGDWNMDTTLSVIVLHSITLSKIRSIDVVIRSDDASDLYPLTAVGNNADVDGYYQGFTGSVILYRTNSGFFTGNTDYDNGTSYNRGWVTIWYID